MKKIIPFISLFVGFLIWHIASTAGWIDSVYFPSPVSILQKAFYLFTQEDDFRKHLTHSLGRLLAGQLIAMPLALLFAFIGVLKKPFAEITNPWFALIYPIPKLALFPFVLIVLGTGDASKISLIALGSFFLMYLTFKMGLQRIYQSEYFDIARVYKISKFKILYSVFLKGALPEILNGLKMGFGYGFVLMVGTEMTMSQNGLGFYMWNSWDQFRLLEMYACLAWISFLGFLIFKICDYFEIRASKKITF